jgi:hypothetical protein
MGHGCECNPNLYLMQKQPVIASEAKQSRSQCWV